jgi:hypothetical protein
MTINLDLLSAGCFLSALLTDLRLFSGSTQHSRHILIHMAGNAVMKKGKPAKAGFPFWNACFT